MIGSTTGTFSYFHAKDQAVNDFDTTQLQFEIEEPYWEEPLTPVKPGDVIEKDPQVRNTGALPFVTRIRIEERWTLKIPDHATAELPLQMVNEDYVRYYSVPDRSFTSQSLLELLQLDQVKNEHDKSFTLLQYLNSESSGWYKGSSLNSPWFYYDRIIQPTEVSKPIFRAITIRTAQDYIPQDGMSDAQYRELCIAYNTKLSKYNLNLIIYAETIQAEPWAWNDMWGADGSNSDLPIGWDTLNWG